MPIPSVSTVTTVSADGYDATVMIVSNVEAVGIAEVAAARAVDSGFDGKVSVIACASAAGGRLVISSTGPLNKDGGKGRMCVIIAARLPHALRASGCGL